MKIQKLMLASLVAGLISPAAWACNNSIGPETVTAKVVSKSSNSASAHNPSTALSSATVGFRITSEGKFHATVILDEAADSTCRIAIHGRMAINGEDGPVAIQSQRRIKTKLLPRGRKKMTFNALRMPPVRQYEGEDAVLNLMTRITCGDTTLTAGPLARYAICGDSRKSSVTARQYIRQLQLKTK